MLVDNLIKEGNELQAKLLDVENEIYNWFVEKFNSPEFEEHLASYFSEDDKRAHKKSFTVEFWDYNSGCSDTHFHAICYSWKNPDSKNWESRNYKGIALIKIQDTLGPRLLELSKQVLEKQGLHVLYTENNESWLKYYDKRIHVNW